MEQEQKYTREAATLKIYKIKVILGLFLIITTCSLFMFIMLVLSVDEPEGSVLNVYLVGGIMGLPFFPIFYLFFSPKPVVTITPVGIRLHYNDPNYAKWENIDDFHIDRTIPTRPYFCIQLKEYKPKYRRWIGGMNNFIGFGHLNIDLGYLKTNTEDFELLLERLIVNSNIKTRYKLIENYKKNQAN